MSTNPENMVKIVSAPSKIIGLQGNLKKAIREVKHHWNIIAGVAWRPVGLDN